MDIVSTSSRKIKDVVSALIDAGKLEEAADLLVKETLNRDEQAISRANVAASALASVAQSVGKDLNGYSDAYERYTNENLGPINQPRPERDRGPRKVDEKAFSDFQRAGGLEWLKESGAGEGAAGLAKGAIGGTSAAWLAYTFAGVAGNASTGTAITTLSGAAAKSATLAWLGGGALKAGGLGIAGGMSLLAVVVAVPAIAWAGWSWVKARGERRLKAAKEKLAAAEAYQNAVMERIQNLIDPLEELCGRMSVLLRQCGKRLRLHARHLRRMRSPWFLHFPYLDSNRFESGVRVANTVVTLLEVPLVIGGGDKGESKINPAVNDEIERAYELLEETMPSRSTRVLEFVLGWLGLR